MAPLSTKAVYTDRQIDELRASVPLNEFRAVGFTSAGPKKGKTPYKSCARCAQMKLSCGTKDGSGCDFCLRMGIPCMVQNRLNTSKLTSGLDDRVGGATQGYVYNLDVANKAKDQIIAHLLDYNIPGNERFWVETWVEDPEKRKDANGNKVLVKAPRIDYNNLCQSIGIQSELRDWEPTSWIHDRSALPTSSAPNQQINQSLASQPGQNVAPLPVQQSAIANPSANPIFEAAIPNVALPGADVLNSSNPIDSGAYIADNTMQGVSLSLANLPVPPLSEAEVQQMVEQSAALAAPTGTICPAALEMVPATFLGPQNGAFKIQKRKKPAARPQSTIQHGAVPTLSYMPEGMINANGGEESLGLFSNEPQEPTLLGNGIPEPLPSLTPDSANALPSPTDPFASMDVNAPLSDLGMPDTSAQIANDFDAAALDFLVADLPQFPPELLATDVEPEEPDFGL